MSLGPANAEELASIPGEIGTDLFERDMRYRSEAGTQFLIVGGRV